MANQYKVEVELGLEYDLGEVLEDSVVVNEDDVVEINDEVKVTFSRARGEFSARVTITVEAEDEDEAISFAQDAVSASYEVEEFVTVQYCNGEVMEVKQDFLIFEATTSRLYASNDARLQSETDRSGEKPVHFLRFDGGEPVFATHDETKVDAFIAGYDLARERA